MPSAETYLCASPNTTTVQSLPSQEAFGSLRFLPTVTTWVERYFLLLMGG